MSIFEDIFEGFVDIGEAVVDVGGDVVEFGSSVFDFFSDSGLIDFAGSLFLQGLDLISAQQAAEAALKAGESQAAVFDLNADLLIEESDKVRFRTEQALTIAKFNGARQLSTQINKYLSSGVTLTGSPLIILEETTTILEFELDRIEEEGLSKAERLEKEADIEALRAENALDEASFRAETVLTQQIIKTGTDLLGFA